MKNFKDMVGKTIESIEGAVEGSEQIVFNFTDGTAAMSRHMHDCCESVSVDHLVGLLENVIGQKIEEAEETHNDHDKPYYYSESHTWTRQHILTQKGYLTIVWLGTSNGYYGETPYFQLTHGRLV